MNDRIKELAKDHFCQTEFDNGHVHECYEFSESELEKFAELIINDCIDLVKPTSHHEAFAQGYMGGVDGLELLYSKISLIRKHFGIEK